LRAAGEKWAVPETLPANLAPPAMLSTPSLNRLFSRRSLLVAFGLNVLCAVSSFADTLLTFDFTTGGGSTVTSYLPTTNTLTGTSVAAGITRPSPGAFNYNADGWSGGSGNTLAYGGSNPAQFTLAFDATGFSNFSVSFAYINESGSSYNFSSVQYRVGGTGGFTSVIGAPTTLTGNGSGSGAGSTYNLDLTSISALNGSSQVEIFFNGTANVPGTIKIDNFVLSGTASAVPEPSTYAMLVGMAGLAFAAFSRRRSVR
jgi:hypothetical protein